MTPKRKSAQKSANTKTKKLTTQVDDPQPVFPVVPVAVLIDGLEALHESEERTSLFQGILRSVSDGILAVNRENQVLFSNDRFAQMWMIPQAIMASKDDTRLLQYVLDQLTDPQVFLQKVQDLYHSNEKSFDTLYFKDGRVFERLSRPMLERTEVSGRVWSFRDVSLRRQIEKELADSEAELRALFASMHDAVLVIDRQGVYRKIAPTNPGLLVKPPDVLLGMNLRDIFPAEKAVLFGRIVQQVLDTKKTAQIEYELIIAGRTTWFQTTISALDEDSTLWVAHDITNRKQAEEALRTAEANYHSIFENATVGIYQSTPQGRFRSVNPVMARIFGFDSPEEMLSSITSIERQYYVDPADRHKFQRLMMEEGRAPEFTSLNLRKDGSHIWIQEDARAVKDANGNILYYEGFVSDITERKQAQEALQRAEQRYRGLFEDAPAMYVITRDVEGSPVVADCNELFSRTLEFSRDELLERPVTDFYSPASRLQLLEGGGYRRALAGEFMIEERELLTRAGRVVPVMVRAVPELDAAGRVLGTRAMFVDISERKRAEEELHRIKNELETLNLELQQSLERETLLACTDGLTGLYNHRHFFELAAREFHAAVRYQSPLTFMMFDVDDFKRVNDIFGHAAGDKLMVEMAQIAAAQVRASDMVARYGGDEFIAMLPHASAQQTLPIAERIQAGVKAIGLQTGNEALTVTLSIGIAEMRHEPVDKDVERVIQRADKALYTAKQSGRNRTVIFEEDEKGAT